MGYRAYVDKKYKLLNQKMVKEAYMWGCINIEHDDTTETPIVIINDNFSWVEFSENDLMEDLERLAVTHINIENGRIGYETGLKFIVKKRMM